MKLLPNGRYCSYRIVHNTMYIYTEGIYFSTESFSSFIINVLWENAFSTE